MRPGEGIKTWISRRRAGKGRRNTEKQRDDSGSPTSSDINELAEEDVWGTVNSSPSSSRSSRESSPSGKEAEGSWMGGSSQTISYAESKGSSSYKGQLGASRSAPVNVPDWTKQASDEDANESEEDDEARLPPHEIVARKYAREPTTSFSVIEGAGRKGRELNKVRNAVWKHTGFFG